MLRHGITYGLGNVANRLAGFLLLPVYTRVLPVDEIGVMWVLTAAGSLLSVTLNLGLTSAIFRFHVTAETFVEKRRIAVNAFFLSTLASMVLLAAVYVAREPVARLLTGDTGSAALLGIVLLATFLDVGIFTPLAVLRAEERSIAFSVIAVGRFLLGIAFALWLVVHREMGVAGVFWSSTLTNVVLYLVLVPRVLRHLRVGFDRTLSRGLLRFGVPIMLATIGSFIVDSSDVWLIRAFRGLEEVSLYGTAYRIAKIIQVVFVQPFVLAWPAIMWSLARRAEGPAVFARILTYAVALVSFAALAMSLFREEVLLVIATDAFLPAAWVLPWIVFSFIPLLASYVLNSGVTLADRTEFIAWGMLVTVIVNLALNLALIPSFGMKGAAVATFVAYTVQASMMFLFGQRLHTITYDWRRIGLIALLVGTLLAVGLGLSGIVPRAAVLLLYPLVLFSPIFLFPDERRRLRMLARHGRERG